LYPNNHIRFTHSDVESKDGKSTSNVDGKDWNMEQGTIPDCITTHSERRSRRAYRVPERLIESSDWHDDDNYECPDIDEDDNWNNEHESFGESTDGHDNNCVDKSPTDDASGNDESFGKDIVSVEDRALIETLPGEGSDGNEQRHEYQKQRPKRGHQDTITVSPSSDQIIECPPPCKVRRYGMTTVSEINKAPRADIRGLTFYVDVPTVHVF
jgi:hypothetical protein